MKFFFVLPFLLLLFGSSQESTLSRKSITRGLNTTLQTNFNGTYQRKNPCTNAEIETSSYIASHEFRHHIKENNWSDYTQKCSAIISSFLQGIGNLVRFNSKQNGTFNFHINTSISQKQDGHCIYEKQCNTLPTIVIEAESCELPPTCKCPSNVDGRENKFLSKKNNVEEVTQNSETPKAFTTLQPTEQKSSFNEENYSTTRCPTKGEPTLIPLQDAITYPVNEKFNDGLGKSNFNPIPEYPESNTQGGMPDFPQEFFNDFSQNEQMTGPEENPQFFGGRDLTTSIRIQPEDDFSTAYPDETLPLDAGKPGLDDSSESLLPPVVPMTSQDFTPGNSGTQNFPSSTISDFETTLEPTFINDGLPSNKYQPSQADRQQNFDELREEVPDFQKNKLIMNNLQPSPRVTVSPKSEFSQIEKPFIKPQPPPVVTRQPIKPLKPFSEDYNERISSKERFQPAELANPGSQMSVPTETNQFQEQAPFVPDVDDIMPYPVPSLSEQNDYIPEMINPQTFKNPVPSVPIQSDNFPNYSDQLETSYPAQKAPFKDYNAPITKYPEVENSFSNEKQTTSQASAFSEYNSDEYLMPTAPSQLPTTPPPFPQVPADQILTNPSETGIPSPTNDFFSPIENNQPLPSVLSPDNLELSQPGFESQKKNVRNQKTAEEPTPKFNDLSEMTSDVNLPPMTSPFDLSTPSYNNPEVLHSFQTVPPKMLPPESLIGVPETEQPVADKTVSEELISDYESPLRYNMSPNPEFREKPVEEPPFELPSSSPSSQYLTTPPPNQIPPPPVDFNNQQPYSDQSSAYANEFQPKPQPPVAPFYVQPSQSPIAQTVSDDYVTALPPDSFLPKSRPNVISYPEPQRFIKSESKRVSDEVMTTPMPTLYSQKNYKTSKDFQASSSSQPKPQDIQAPAAEQPLQPIEQFPDSLTKYSAEMSSSTPIKEPSPYSDPFLNEPPIDDSDLPQEINDDYYIPVMEDPHKKEKMFVDELSIDDANNQYTTVPPNLKSFTIYDSEEPNQGFQTTEEAKLTSPAPEGEFLTEKQSSFPTFSKNDAYSRGQAFSNAEATSNYKSNRYTEQISSDNQKTDFQPLLLPNQRLNTQRPETTPLPSVPKYSSSGKPRKQTQAVSYSEASAQSSSEVFLDQNNQPVSKSYSESHSSSYSSPVQKKSSSFITDNQRTKFSSSSNKQMTDSTRGFQQPTRQTSDVKLNFPSNIENRRQQSFVGNEKNIFRSSSRPVELEQPEYYSFEKPVGDLLSEQSFDEIGAPDSRDYSTDFLPTTPSSEPQTPSLLTYSNPEPEAASMTFNDQLSSNDFQQKDLPFSTDPQTISGSDSMSEGIPADAPDFQFANQPFSETTNEQTRSEPFNRFSETPTPSQFIRSGDYPTPLDTAIPLPQPDYIEENSGNYSPSMDSTFVSQPRSKIATEAKSFATSSASFSDKEPFVGEETTPSVPQNSFNFLKKVPNYSPAEPQPQPSDDNLDIPNDNAPLQFSRTFDSLTTTSQSTAKSFQNTQTDFEESTAQGSTSAERNIQSSEDFVTPPTSFSVTEIPSFQMPELQLKSDFLTVSNERSQENTGAQETLILGDNVSPQPQPTSAVKYNEELETAQYQTSPAPNPQPQTTLNYANQLSDDNPSGKLPGFFTEQQRLENYDFNIPSPNDQNPLVDASESFLQPKEAIAEELDAIYSGGDSQQAEEAFTTDYPADMTSQLPLGNPNSKESYLPYNSQLRTQPIYQQPSPPEQESLIYPTTPSSQSLPQPLDEGFSFQQSQNSEKEQSKLLSNENVETFTPNETPSLVPGMTDGISKIQRRLPVERQTSNFPERYYYTDRNLNSSPRRFSSANETKFTPSFQPKRTYLPIRSSFNHDNTPDSQGNLSYNTKPIKGTERDATGIPTFQTESLLQRQSTFKNRGASNIQPLSSENKRYGSYNPPSRNVPQYPQQVEPFPDRYDTLRRPEIQPQFSGQDYPDYDQVFPNSPPTYDEVNPRDPQMDDGREQFGPMDTDMERQSYVQNRPMKEKSEEQGHSNPLFETLHTQMALHLHDPPSDMPKRQNDFRDNSSGFQKNTREPPQPESQLVSDLTNPSNNPDRTTNGRFNYMDRPLYEESMRSVSAPERF